MTDTLRWKTKTYTITGWIGFGLFLLVIATDAVLAALKRPTFTQYIIARDSDQHLFGWIVLSILVFLILHFFWKKLFGKK